VRRASLISRKSFDCYKWISYDNKIWDSNIIQLDLKKENTTKYTNIYLYTEISV
jgi:hypothetical protein